MSLGKAAALADSITRRHPFVYGNNRTAAIYMVAYLLEKLGYKLEAEQKKLEDFVVRIIRRTFEPEDIAFWFEEHAHEI